MWTVNLTLTTVSGGNGTSNVGMITHKGMKPSQYGVPGSAGHNSDMTIDRTDNVFANRVAYVMQQDNNTTTQTSGGYAYGSDEMSGSPHSGAMPVAVADGSVRMILYSVDHINLTHFWNYNTGAVALMQ